MKSKNASPNARTSVVNVEVTMRLITAPRAVSAGEAMARLRAYAEKRGWEVVQVQADDAPSRGARPMLVLVPGVVGEVVRLREAGLTLAGIAADLNARGVVGARGGRWWARTVQAALRQARRAR